MVDVYLDALEMCYFEVTEAFRGLADENVWKRPAEGLLSVGELAGHVAYWEARKFAGEGKVSSPLIDERFRYYQTTLATPPSEDHLAMTAEEVCREALRVHEEAVAHFRALNPDLESHPPGWPPEYTYREFLKYAVFHVGYHTGQMYSARHLLGEETPDN
jgi:uncharacterized damage-inducible protein DinB